MSINQHLKDLPTWEVYLSLVNVDTECGTFTGTIPVRARDESHAASQALKVFSATKGAELSYIRCTDRETGFEVVYSPSEYPSIDHIPAILGAFMSFTHDYSWGIWRECEGEKTRK